MRYTEMGFSEDGLHPIQSQGCFVGSNAVLYKQNLNGTMEPLPKLRNTCYRFFAAPFIPESGDKFQNVPVLVYEVQCDDLEEWGAQAKAIEI